MFLAQGLPYFLSVVSTENITGNENRLIILLIRGPRFSSLWLPTRKVSERQKQLCNVFYRQTIWSLLECIQQQILQFSTIYLVVRELAKVWSETSQRGTLSHLIHKFYFQWSKQEWSYFDLPNTIVFWSLQALLYFRLQDW